MKAVKLALLELRRFRGGRARPAALLALLLVPLLYSAVFLWPNWDPYGRLSQVPVAVVNNDRPVRVAGQHINAGEQFVRQLRVHDLFDWHFVDAEEARDGLRHGRYYFTVTVPRDFSARLATVTRRNPQPVSLRITGNDANGYLAGIMADTAGDELRDQIDAAVNAVYATALYGEIDAVRTKLRRASNTAEGLVDGIGLSKQGAAGLTEGLTGMSRSARRITADARQLAGSARRLDRRLTAASNIATRNLPSAVDSLMAAGNAAVTRIGAVAATTGTIARRTGAGLDGLRELADRHPGLSDDPAYRSLLANARALDEAAESAESRASRALSRARRASDEAAALQQGIGTLRARLSAAAGPAESVVTGASRLATSTATLTSGLDGLAASSRVLRDGTAQLHESARELAGLIEDGLSRIPPAGPTRVARAAEVLGSPTNLVERDLNPAHVYGRGMAPLLFAVGLWVFGLVAYLLLRPVNTRALAGRARAPTVALAGWLPAAALGVLGALLMLAVVTAGLGLAPVRPWQAVGLLALAAAAFVAIEQLLRTALGTAAGGAVSVVLLIVQLSASGGLYPLETMPAPFRAIHPYLPMTYLVDGLRVTVSGGLTEHLLRDLAVLAGFLLFSMMCTALVVRYRRTWTVRGLHPQIPVGAVP